MDAIEATRQLLRTNLGLGERADSMSADTVLMGNLPEFDSMAVVSLIGAIEDEFGCEVDDGEITAEIFETLGSLAEFVETKMN